LLYFTPRLATERAGQLAAFKLQLQGLWRGGLARGTERG
jgi:hypothetical protein